MTAWFKRARQTRTPVDSPKSDAQNRRRGIFAAYRVMTATQIAAQLMLWVTLFCYDQTTKATWQAALLLIVPLAALWAVWNAGRMGVRTRAGGWAALLLLPCLILDATLLTNALSGLLMELLPFYPRVLHIVLVAAFCFLTVCLGRENGVAYGVNSMRVWLLALFLLATVLLGADSNAGRLWPLLGQGFGKTATAALSGVGGVWGVALMFFLPLSKEARHSADLPRTHPVGQPLNAVWTLLPWALGVVWALWSSMVRPWRSGDALSIGERMMGMARHSASILLNQLTSVMWLLLLVFSLAGCIVSGEKILRNAAPKVPRSVAGATTLLPATLIVIFWPDLPTGALGYAFPYRAALSLLAGLLMVVISRKGAKA